MSKKQKITNKDKTRRVKMMLGLEAASNALQLVADVCGEVKKYEDSEDYAKNMIDAMVAVKVLLNKMRFENEQAGWDGEVR